MCQEKAHIRYFWSRMKESSYRPSLENIRHRIVKSCAPKSSSWPLRAYPTSRSVNGSSCHGRSYRNGESVSLNNAWPVCKSGHGADAPRLFPPEIVMEIKALACQLPRDLGLPFSRLTRDEIARQAVRRGIVASISGATVWRWLSQDVIRPWCYRSWIWPRDPDFEHKAGKILDLYHGTWRNEPLTDRDFVVSADEKTSIQARHRLAPTTPPAPGRYGRVEHEYERKGALAYMAAWDVRHARVFGLCRRKTGIESFHDLVDLVMSQAPYQRARRVFWITDNGSSHRSQVSTDRLKSWYPNAILVHTPIHASWLNQVEIYFSILQRKVLTPNDFDDLEQLEKMILDFQAIYEKAAKPFEWKFSRQDLRNILAKAGSIQIQQRMAA